MKIGSLRSPSRRAFLVGSGCLVAAVTGGSIYKVFLAPPSLPHPQIRPALPDLPDFSGSTLAAREVDLALADKRNDTGLGYNGGSPGPTIRVKSGDRFQKTIVNDLMEPTTVHWHGLIPPPEMDGHPETPIAPGSTGTVDFPVHQRASLNWYHPHPHGRTASQIWRGLAGAFIIEDDEEAALRLPDGEHELVLVLRDARLSPFGAFSYRNSGRGDFPIINGKAYPARRLGRSLYRFRIINAANRRVFDIGIDAPMVLIGNDGGLLERPATVDSVTLSPGERIDVLIDLTKRLDGDRCPLSCKAAGWTLLDIEIDGSHQGQTRTIPQTLSTIDTLSHEGPPDRVFRFEGHNHINGQSFELGEAAFVVPFGTVERWRFESHGGAPHPVHVHGAHFQVVAREGGRNQVFPWERGWKDTVLLQRGESVEILIAFRHYHGRYLIHCHRLEHEDHGMMLNFDVADPV